MGHSIERANSELTLEPVDAGDVAVVTLVRVITEDRLVLRSLPFRSTGPCHFMVTSITVENYLVNTLLHSVTQFNMFYCV